MTNTGPTQVVTAPVTFPASFGIPQMAALARDLAVALYDVDKIIADNGLTKPQYDALLKNDYFQNVLKKVSSEWQSAGATQERIALQARLLLERALPTIGVRLEDGKEALSSVIEGVSTLAKLGGVGAEKRDTSPQEKFVINIDLGGDRQVFETSRPVIDATAAVLALPEGAGEPAPGKPVPERARKEAPVQSDPEGPGAKTPV